MGLKRLFLIGLLGVPLWAVGQADWKPLDSTRLAMQKRPGFRLGLDGRQSVISAQPVSIFGIRYGLDYDKVGFYTGFYSTFLDVFRNNDSSHLRVNYVSSTFEYYLYETWRYELVSTYQIGIGKLEKYTKRADGSRVYSSNTVIPIELGLNGTIRFLRYFGVSAGFGIRFSPIDGQGFAGPFYSGGLTYFTGTMYKDAKKLFKKLKE